MTTIRPSLEAASPVHWHNQTCRSSGHTMHHNPPGEKVWSPSHITVCRNRSVFTAPVFTLSSFTLPPGSPTLMCVSHQPPSSHTSTLSPTSKGAEIAMSWQTHTDTLWHGAGCRLARDQVKTSNCGGESLAKSEQARQHNGRYTTLKC